MYQNMLVVIDPNQDDQPALRELFIYINGLVAKLKPFCRSRLLIRNDHPALSGRTYRYASGVISQRTAWIHEQAKYYLNAAFPLKLKWSGITVLSKPSFRSDQRRARFGAKNGAPT